MRAAASALLVVAAAALGAAGGEGTPEEEYGLARSAFEDGLYTFALKRFDRLRQIKGFSRADDSGLYASRCQFRLGRFDEAIGGLQGFAKAYPGSALKLHSRLWLGRSYLEKASREASNVKRNDYLGQAKAVFDELTNGKPADRLLRADAEYFAARTTFEMAQHGRAAMMLRKFLEAHPRSPFVAKAKLLYGDALYRLYRFEEAASVLTEVLGGTASGEAALDAVLIRAECFYCLKDWKRALEDYGKAAGLAGTDSMRAYQARYGAGWAHYQLSKERSDEGGREDELKAALAEFEAVSKLPASTRIGRAATFKVGQIHFELEDYGKAIPVLEQCTPSKTFTGLHLQARYLLAKANRLSGRHGKALAWLQEIERYGEERSVPEELAIAAGQEKAEILSETGKPLDAAKSYLAVRDHATTTRAKAEMYFMAAMAYLNAEELGRERYVKARRMLEDIVRQKKLASELSFSRLHYYLAFSIHGLALDELRRKNPGAADELFSLAAEKYAKIRSYREASSYARMAATAEAGIHMERGKPADACGIYEDLLRAGVEDESDRAGIHVACARARQRAGERNRAVAHLDAALALQGCTGGCRADALFLRAECLYGAGDERAAEQAYAKFLEGFASSPDGPEAALKRGELLVGLGDADGAVRSFDLSARLAGGRPEGDNDGDALSAKLRAAHVVLSSGRKAEAKQRYAEIAAGKGRQAWEAELALAGIDLEEGRAADALKRLARVLEQAGAASERARRAAELAGRIHLAAKENEKAEKMFRLAVESSSPELSAKGLAGLASSLYAQNRFTEAAETYTSLYLAARGEGPREGRLREQGVRGAVSSLRRSLEGASRGRKLKLIAEAAKIARLSKDLEWRKAISDDLRALEKAERSDTGD